MKILVPNYSCLQNPWLGGYRPQIPVLSALNWICWTPPEQNSWVCHWSMLPPGDSRWHWLFVLALWRNAVFRNSTLVSTAWQSGTGSSR